MLPKLVLDRLEKTYTNIFGAYRTLLDSTSIHMSKVDNADPVSYRALRVQFDGIIKGMTDWLMAYKSAIKAVNTTAQDEILAGKLADAGNLIVAAVSKLNKEAWWKSPTTAVTLATAPFKVAAAVAVDIAHGFEIGGQGLLKQLSFLSGNWLYIAGAVAALYFLGPVLIKSLSGGKHDAP